MTTAPAPVPYSTRANHKTPLQADLSEYVFGKVQPQAIPLEEVVLGALMLDREALTLVMETLRPESFYLEAHQHIYRAILHLFERSLPVDLLTVTEELRKTGAIEKIGGGYYLVELTNRIASAANIEHHARIIEQKYIQRQLIQVGTGIVRTAYEDATDVFEALGQAEQSLFQLSTGHAGGEAQSASDIVMLVLRQIEKAAQCNLDGTVAGVPSGLRDIDTETGGFQNSDLIIVAGRPGMGKTAWAINTVACNAARAGIGVGVFSLEMSKTQLVTRMLSSSSGIQARAMATGKLHDSDWQRIQDATEGIHGLPIHIDDTPGISGTIIRAKARRMKMKHNIGLLIVDYLQLMEGEGGNEEQRVGNNGRMLKLIAKELDIPVICLSQLNRAVETRGGTKRPQLSDLRASGQIEEHADIVAFLYRPEYYKIEWDEEGNSLKGVAEFDIAKHRAGKLGPVYLKFEGEYTRFTDKDANPFPAAPPANFSRIENGPRTEDEDMPF